jgi:hypothetical protein
MELPMIIVPLPNQGGFSATLPFLEFSAEGATADEAQARLAVLLKDRLHQGMEIRSLNVPSASAPAGWLADDELTDEWLQHIQNFRAECDAKDRKELEELADSGEIAP